MILVIALATLAIPRIVPMPRRACAHHLKRWGRDCTDEVEKRRLLLSQSMCGIRDRSDFGCVAVVHGSRVRALSLLEHMRDESVRVWFLHTNDHESGTMFLQLLVNEVPGISLAADVDDRWRIALAYIRAHPK